LGFQNPSQQNLENSYFHQNFIQYFLKDKFKITKF